MQCYIDAKDGTTREAVAVCAECGAGLCVQHLVDEEMPRRPPPGLGGSPERGRLILCEECAEVRRGMTPARPELGTSRPHQGVTHGQDLVRSLPRSGNRISARLRARLNPPVAGISGRRPVGVGKTFLATALGHAAVRRKHSVHFERADKMFKRLRAARLDQTYDEEMRRLQRVELLILDDLALHSLGPTETSDFYELVVERHRSSSMITTSNRDPAEIVTMMADPLLAQSAIDRLRSAAYELVVEGQSYRQRQKPVAGSPADDSDTAS